ncbi:MAG TPA: LytTR family transcriptional regulator [Hydrogenispora sp.]|jgi:DNA-binding LytR/AlgR family response regulator|nr:LytTR family transcriptional regulator [Hydrogenispora sp.]
MRIIARKVDNQPLTVIVEYPVLDEKARKVLQWVHQLDIQFVGKIDDKLLKIGLDEIYYFETVERKVFIYTKEEVFQLQGSITDVERMMMDSDLVRVSRTCIINTDHLQEIRQLKNSRLEATMDNNEKIIVSRKYLREIKNVFRRGTL